MIKHCILLGLIVFPLLVSAQTLTLDSCRNLAINNNRTIKMAQEKMAQARYDKRVAQSAYFPALDFNMLYIRNQNEVSLWGDNESLPILSSFLSFDVRNVGVGAVTITQPIFMGGKIFALNRMADYAEQIAELGNEYSMQELVYKVDEAYWRVVSLQNKVSLAENYCKLVDTLSYNVHAMYKEGVMTQGDCLAVDVKSNEAKLMLLKAVNGLTLSKMALSQLCGLDIEADIRLTDTTDGETDNPMLPLTQEYNQIFRRRTDLQMLGLGVQIYRQRERVALSEMLPKLTVVGAYLFTNPNVVNGFENRFKGGFSFGATLSVPLWHWGGNYNRLRSAKTQTLIEKLEFDEAQDMIKLQISQCRQQLSEAYMSYRISEANCEKATEYLRDAQIGFKEGVVAVDVAIAAHVAWLEARTEKIDSEIMLRMSRINLSKALGEMEY